MSTELRETGETTRITDQAIQALFNKGGIAIRVGKGNPFLPEDGTHGLDIFSDHHENGGANLYYRVRKRLEIEHRGSFKESKQGPFRIFRTINNVKNTID